MKKLLTIPLLITFIGLGSLAQTPAEDIKESAILKHHDGLDGAVGSVAFSPDGAILASAYTVTVGPGRTVKGYVVLWDVAKKSKVKTIECPGAVQFVTYSPDGKFVAAAQYDRGPQVRILDTTTWEDRHLLSFKDDGASFSSISAIAFAPDGKRLVIATFGYSQGIKLKIIDPATGKDQETLKIDGTDEVSVRSLSFSADGKLLTSISDKTVSVWDVKSDKVRNSFAVGRGNLAAMSPDGKNIAVASIGSRKYPGVVGLTLRDSETGRILIDFEGSSLGTGTALLFTPDGKRLIYGRNPGVIVVYDATTGRRLSASDGPNLNGLAITSAGNLVASANATGSVWLWDIGPGE
jgi:WD40 repeat protein